MYRSLAHAHLNDFGRPFGYAAAVSVLRAIDLFAAELKCNCTMLGLTRAPEMSDAYLRMLSPASHFERYLGKL